MGKTGVIILAGGNSSRFGTPKPFLPFDKTSTFLEKIVYVYKDFGCHDIILVLNQKYSEIFNNTFPENFRTELKIVYNSNPGLGRFYSLKLGADSVRDTEFCFIQNIDNPFTDEYILKKLFENRNENSFVSPLYKNKGGHPVLIPGQIIEKIRDETDISLNTKDFLNRFNKIGVEVENDKILANINSPEDYKEYFE